MISKKEKLIAKYIYGIGKSSGNYYAKKDDLLRDMVSMITEPDIHHLFIYNQSIYIKWRGAVGYILELTPQGIGYMDDKHTQDIKEWAFWITTTASIIAAIYSVVSYYKLP